MSTQHVFADAMSSRDNPSTCPFSQESRSPIERTYKDLAAEMDEIRKALHPLMNERSAMRKMFAMDAIFTVNPLLAE
jgi:hypothetical protein